MDTIISDKNKKPAWLRRRLPTGPVFESVRTGLRKNRLHTVCQAAHCPNIWECFSNKTATFLILGDRCTRSCRFCAISQGPPQTLDPEEPLRVAEAAREMQLDYVVVTSVTRDDLPDGGSGHFAASIRNLRKAIPDVKVETLIPDFLGDSDALRQVLSAHPDVLNHNIETAARLYDRVRPEASYVRSLEILKRTTACCPGMVTKSGLMLGVGETDSDIAQTLKDLRSTGCRLLTLGQYLQPSTSHLPVDRFITPKQFDFWRLEALKLGFEGVASAPFVRSSYHAKDLLNARPHSA